MSVLYTLVAMLARLFNVALIARVLLSWFPLDRSNPTLDSVVRVLYAITEPVLGPIRRAVPSVAGLDISPVLAILLVQALVSILARFA
ncbi:MAG: YggT family protein [Chloroflexi bacterium]|nr:YggT family protein [Chloroflexota bacterium]